MTVHAIRQYLRYRWRAQGRHGTHSPFVYGFVEQVLRRKEGTLEGRILHYTGEKNFLPEEALQNAGEHSVVNVRRPHASPAATVHWRGMCARPEVTLSLDLYGMGLLFFRKDFKAKQHFILR